jgi:hypothetical protein
MGGRIGPHEEVAGRLRAGAVEWTEAPKGPSPAKQRKGPSLWPRKRRAGTTSFRG